jgi:hypothetical protein
LKTQGVSVGVIQAENEVNSFYYQYDIVDTDEFAGIEIGKRIILLFFMCEKKNDTIIR